MFGRKKIATINHKIGDNVILDAEFSLLRERRDMHLRHMEDLRVLIAQAKDMFNQHETAYHAHNEILDKMTNTIDHEARIDAALSEIEVVEFE